jgi:FMN phosphatase YigB (HAD superfamily)
MAKVRAILVDFGNVLVYFDKRTDILKRIALGFDGREDGIDELFPGEGEAQYESIDSGAMTHKELWQKFCEVSGIAQAVLPLDMFSVLYVEHLRPVKLVVDLLRRVQDRYHLVGVSNGDFGSVYVCRLLEVHYGIKFLAAFVSCDFGVKKPALIDRAVVALRRLGRIAPEECVFVDDVPAYVEAAKQYGMKGIVFDARHDSVDDLEERLRFFGVEL